MADRNSTRKPCSVEGCCNISQARGYCKTHWARWRKHGDPLKGEDYKLPDKCEVEGCCRDARSRWNYSIAVCAMHYLRNYASKMKSDPLFVLKVRSNEYKRKARKKNAFLEDVDRNAVMARDKWTCHLCKEKIPKNAAWPDRLFGTLDHIVPLAKGGKHSYANIKAAHLTCNCSKNDKIIGQLGLEFAA